MIIHQDCYNKNYTVNFHEDYIEIIINFIPKDNYNRGKLYFDLIPYYEIDNTIIKYKNNVFYNNEELKSFFKRLNQRKLSL